MTPEDAQRIHDDFVKQQDRAAKERIMSFVDVCKQRLKDHAIHDPSFTKPARLSLVISNVVPHCETSFTVASRSEAMIVRDRLGVWLCENNWRDVRVDHRPRWLLGMHELVVTMRLPS